jgi:hypothetical protein
VSRLNMRIMRLEDQLNPPSGPARILWIEQIHDGLDQPYADAARAAIQEAISPVLFALDGPHELAAFLSIGPGDRGQVEAAGRSWRYTLIHHSLTDAEALLLEDYTRP